MKNKFDGVLLDLTMPEFSVIDVIDHLSAVGKLRENKIIAYSNDSMSKQVAVFHKIGVNQILTKPIIDDLENALVSSL